MPGHAIIAIGGSAGSIEVIRQICKALPVDLPACVLIAVHVGAGNQNLLAGILESKAHVTFLGADFNPVSNTCGCDVSASGTRSIAFAATRRPAN